MSESLRILVANEPRAYRDAYAGMLCELLPTAVVESATPEEIESAFTTLAPHLVICSDLTDVVKSRAFSWVLLYPGDADIAVICIDNQQSVIQGVSIDHLLGVIEQIVGQLGLSEEAAPRLAAEAGPAPYHV